MVLTALQYLGLDTSCHDDKEAELLTADHGSQVGSADVRVLFEKMQLKLRETKTSQGPMVFDPSESW